MIVRVVQRDSKFVLEAKKCGASKWGKHCAILKEGLSRPSYESVRTMCKKQGHKLVGLGVWPAREMSDGVK